MRSLPRSDNTVRASSLGSQWRSLRRCDGAACVWVKSDERGQIDSPERILSPVGECVRKSAFGPNVFIIFFNVYCVVCLMVGGDLWEIVRERKKIREFELNWVSLGLRICFIMYLFPVVQIHSWLIIPHLHILLISVSHFGPLDGLAVPHLESPHVSFMTIGCDHDMVCRS